MRGPDTHNHDQEDSSPDPQQGPNTKTKVAFVVFEDAGAVHPKPFTLSAAQDYVEAHVESIRCTVRTMVIDIADLPPPEPAEQSKERYSVWLVDQQTGQLTHHESEPVPLDDAMLWAESWADDKRGQVPIVWPVDGPQPDEVLGLTKSTFFE